MSASPDVGYMLLLIGGGLSLLLGMCYGLRPAYFFTQRSRKKNLLPASKGYFPLTLWICMMGLMTLAGADGRRAIFIKMDREGSVLTREKHYFLIFSYHYRPL